jgi:hypothetical protein
VNSEGRSKPRSQSRSQIRGLPQVAILVSVAVIAVSGCGSVVVTTPPADTGVPIAATPWPNGTVGRYGLRIDPTLLGKLPAQVGGDPIAEAAGIEAQDLDNADLPASFEGIAEGSIGEITDANWLRVSIGRLRPEAQTDDFYTNWRDQYDQGVCSRADGVASTQIETMADRSVDVATCKGGVIAYTVRFADGLLVSAQDLGPRRLGRQLMLALP